MIAASTFSREHLERVHASFPTADIGILERAMFALALLELLVDRGLSFIFKGGTSLLLHLEKPYRLSTDIDILALPRNNIEKLLNMEDIPSPFTRYEEMIRNSPKDLVKRHFRFAYKSCLSHKEQNVILDVLIDENHYANTIQRPIVSPLLVQDDREPVNVSIPTIGSLIADKLTAFAPMTIGVPFFFKFSDGASADRTMDVAKQFLDIASLIGVCHDCTEAIASYHPLAEAEIRYRGLNISPRDALIDALETSICVYSKGKLFPERYNPMLRGMNKLQNHLIDISISGETAIAFAAHIAALIAQIYGNRPMTNYGEHELLLDERFRVINKMRKLDKNAFNQMAFALKTVYGIR